MLASSLTTPHCSLHLASMNFKYERSDMAEIPETLSGVTPQWLSSQLREAGHPFPPIKSLIHEPMDGFTGAMGEVGIFRVD